MSLVRRDVPELGTRLSRSLGLPSRATADDVAVRERASRGGWGRVGRGREGVDEEGRRDGGTEGGRDGGRNEFLLLLFQRRLLVHTKTTTIPIQYYW